MSGKNNPTSSRSSLHISFKTKISIVFLIHFFSQIIKLIYSQFYLFAIIKSIFKLVVYVRIC